MIKNMQQFSAAVAVATALGITASSPAFATGTPAITTATVSAVELNNNGTTSTPQLLIQLNTSPLSNYYANVNSAPCSGLVPPSWDTAKTWASMAQAALLSGKKLNIYWLNCGTPRFIVTMDLLSS